MTVLRKCYVTLLFLSYLFNLHYNYRIVTELQLQAREKNLPLYLQTSIHYFDSYTITELPINGLERELSVKNLQFSSYEHDFWTF